MSLTLRRSATSQTLLSTLEEDLSIFKTSMKHNCNYNCIHFMVLVFGWTGLFTVNDVHNMTDEILKMKHFDHPNVMTMIGVCVSIGGGPAIVMPYMENGSLLSYLRKDKKNITTSDDHDLDTVSPAHPVIITY